jgi:hypothetical protein
MQGTTGKLKTILEKPSLPINKKIKKIPLLVFFYYL